LSHICDFYGLDLKKVATINKLKRPYKLRVGETVYLPVVALLDEKSGTSDIRTAGKEDSAKRDAKKRSVRNVAKAIRGRRDPAVPKLKFPVPGGVLTSPFGHRWGVFHRGLDIAANRGTPVLACSTGKVIFTGTRARFRNYGKVVLLDHGNGIYTHYAHLKKILVKQGQKVKRGQKIALVGNTGKSTGPHLHLEVRVRNNLYNPLAYFSSTDLQGMRVTKRFTNSPMGPVQASWRIPELLTAKR
jgi:murein DD-endopeptidase MepM/ murein hydrolase activator NlpD